jgi:hypothetical protein
MYYRRMLTEVNKIMQRYKKSASLATFNPFNWCYYQQSINIVKEVQDFGVQEFRSSGFRSSNFKLNPYL